MISQIERHVKHSEFDQALALLPMLHQVFADHTELSHVITQLQQDLLAHIGAISIEQSMFEDINCTKVGARFTDDTDLQMLRRWRFLD